MTNTNKTVDFAALELLCDKLECGDAKHRATANQIRIAISGAKPQLPEGIEWPRFTDGELVRFGDEFVSWDGETHKVRTVEIFSPEVDHDYAINSRATHNFVGGKKSSHGEFVKRPEPEVLDADGVPIKVGDTVYAHNAEPLTVRELTSKALTLIEDSNGILWEIRSDKLTHRKPDTQESIDGRCRELCELAMVDDKTYCMLINGFAEVLERQRKLMGGE